LIMLQPIQMLYCLSHKRLSIHPLFIQEMKVIYRLTKTNFCQAKRPNWNGQIHEPVIRILGFLLLAPAEFAQGMKRGRIC
jgi:hypothetical protein